MDQYIGQKKIAMLNDMPGSDRILVEFEDKTSETLTKKMVTACLTPSPLDATSLREHYTTFIVGDILKVLSEYDIKNIDFDYIQQVTKFSHDGWKDMAVAAKFGKDFRFVSMSQIQEALDEGKAKGISVLS